MIVLLACDEVRNIASRLVQNTELRTGCMHSCWRGQTATDVISLADIPLFDSRMKTS